MTASRIENHAGLSEESLSALLAVVSKHQSLDQIFVWGRSQSPQVIPTDVVKQDEFTHDVLVPVPGGNWLVYGTT